MNEKSKILNHSDKQDDKTCNTKIDAEILALEENIALNKDILFNKKQDIYKEVDKINIRTRKDIENTYKFSLEKQFVLFLPIVDNLERALILLNSDVNNIDVTVVDKLKATIKDFLEILNDFGITVINTVNVLFNPDIHQAMSIQHSDHIKENHVISILQNGYLLNGRLLRPAMVSVSKTKI